MSEKIKGKTIRLKNRRVFMGRLKDGGYLLGFKRLPNPGEKNKKRVIISEISLSAEAMSAVVALYITEIGHIA